MTDILHTIDKSNVFSGEIRLRRARKHVCTPIAKPLPYVISLPLFPFPAETSVNQPIMIQKALPTFATQGDHFDANAFVLCCTGDDQEDSDRQPQNCTNTERKRMYPRWSR